MAADSRTEGGPDISLDAECSSKSYEPPIPLTALSTPNASSIHLHSQYHFDSSAIKLEGDEDPRNWSSARKWYITSIISLMGFISPLGSSIVVPGCMYIDFKFRLHSRTLSLLTVSLFVLGLGIGPFLLAPASELKGRQPIYVLSSFVFVLFNLGSTLVHNFTGLLILRFLAGAAGSTGPSLGAGSIGDMFSPRDRGRAQSVYGLGPLLGPVCGTIAGGWIGQGLRNWRWLLGVLTILSAAITLLVLITLRETYGPVLLKRKIQKLARRHLEEVMDEPPIDPIEREYWQAHRIEIEQLISTSRSISINGLSPKVNKIVSLALPSHELLDKLKLAFSRPFRLLFGNPICAIFSLYMGYIYGIIFLFITQHPLLFERREAPGEPSPRILPTYGWREGPASLTYLGLGLGFLTAAAINVLLQDGIYARLVLSNGRIGFFLFQSRKRVAQHFIDEKGKDVEVGQGVEAVVAIASGDAVVNSTINKEVTAAIPKEGPTAITPAAAVLPLKGRPEYRLPLCLLGMFILPGGLLLFGWSATCHAHFMVPLAGSFLVGVGAILPFQSILVYLVDAFIPFSASATACAVLVRCTLAAIFPLFSQQMFVAIGYGWGSTLLALVSLIGIPAPVLLYIYGEQLRSRFKFSG